MERTRVYDLVMTHQLDADDFFIHRVQYHCAERGLNFFLVEPLWVDRFYEALARDEVWARVLLNMHSEHHLPDDIYHRLVWLAHRKNTWVIDAPEVAQAAFDKARIHHRLVEAGLRVPRTVIVSAAEAGELRLSEEDRARLGTPFVIKPSHGYGRRGVILDAQGEADLARSAAAWPNPSYLLQELITARREGDQPAYWRAFYAFGEIWICWWNCFTDSYREPMESEWETHRLDRIERIMRELAQLTGMHFFSSEIAETSEGELVLIDYVNDQCHMLCQSASPRMGVPDGVVAAIARKLVEGAESRIRSRAAA